MLSISRFSLYYIFFLLILISCHRSSKKFDGLNGTKTNYHKNGKVRSEIEFKDGLMHGKCHTYYSSGVVRSEITYKGNLKNGSSKQFYENGQLKSLSFYKDEKKTAFSLTIMKMDQ